MADTRGFACLFTEYGTYESISYVRLEGRNAKWMLPPNTYRWNSIVTPFLENHLMSPLQAHLQMRP